ncbi:MAG: hypothetical protein E6344_11190 [Clostridium sp.]|nr:hypothetical protein [Clostridium sp.]MDU7084251.1 hypothetical protein [Clostridium sp.]
MVIEANVRDLNTKNRKFRNDGKTIGIVKRINGESIPVSMTRSKLMTYLGRNSNTNELMISLNGEHIRTSIEHIERDVVLHFAHHIQLKEIE